MTRIETHLQRLLLQHDCLVIPGLGGFVCTKLSAQYDDVASELIPPRRAVQFNERLLHNDGVLAHAVVVAEGVTYAEALETIEAESADLRAGLRAHHAVVLENVGRLFVGTNGVTQFMAEPELERLLEGFGLQRIPLKSLEHRTMDTPVLPISGPTRWPRIAAAIAIPLMAGSMWWFSGLNDTEALSVMPNWGVREVVSAYCPVEKVAILETLEEVTAYNALTDVDSPTIRVDFETHELTETGIAICINEPVTVAEVLDVAESEPTIVASSRFALVAGAFSIEGNAMGHAKTLLEKGLQAEVRRLGALHFVTVGLFVGEKEAREALISIRAQGNESVWLKRL